MRYRRGFYAGKNIFISHPDADNVLVMSPWTSAKRTLITWPIVMFMFTLVVSVTLAILTFRNMLSVVETHKTNPVVSFVGASTIAAIMNSVWISVMNAAYAHIARSLNDKENHRTDTQHEDALILKIFLFQFFNSCRPLRLKLGNSGAARNSHSL